MDMENNAAVVKDTIHLGSHFLQRDVTLDFYLPKHVARPSTMSLLLINDGQDMEKLGLRTMLDYLHRTASISPVLCVGIHAGHDRKFEYGTAKSADFKGRGSRAREYDQFVMEELLPLVHSRYTVPQFRHKAFAGFSLGGLSALDMVINHPHEFSLAGVFSGSLWWRSKDKHDKTYNDETDRIMHQQVLSAPYYPWLKFFFECGERDEREDRNNNGVIDSIDDTLDLIRDLRHRGYDQESIFYLQLKDGKHDVNTWARAMPVFLKWGWGHRHGISGSH